MTKAEREWLKTVVSRAQMAKQPMRVSKHEKALPLPRRWKYLKSFCRYCGRPRAKKGACKEHRSLVAYDLTRAARG